MEEILERFDNTLGTARAEEELSHKDLYKNWGRYGNQEERRNEILRLQKSNRENKLDNIRGILSLLKTDEESSSIFRKSSQAKYQQNVYVPGFTNSTNFYFNNVLMHSEWMVEKPEDFSTNWLMMPCPKGTRTLVVASNGMTRFYTKYGQLYHTTCSLLPGGNANEKWKNCSVLDGFYCKDTNTMYILDILSWNNHIMADGEMEFRRYWLDTTFKEHPYLEKVTKRNKVSFKLLPITPCLNDSLEQFMMTHPPLETAKVDGLLFYHKYAHYIAGETPLVGWLYPYMVPEVLCPDLKIHQFYAAEKPQDYVNQATFIQKFEEKIRKKKTPFNRGKKNKHSTSETSMEADDGPVGKDDKAEGDITDQNASENASNNDGDTGTMETENGVNRAENTLNQGNTVAKKHNVDNKGRVQVPTKSTSLFSDQDSTQQQAMITKYYSYFN